MISTSPELPLNYSSLLYTTLEEKVDAVRKKNRSFKRVHDGYREKVWYPDDTNLLCWLNQEIDNRGIHWHPAIEILMPLVNTYTIELEGVEVILQEGDILVIPPGCLHHLTDPFLGSRFILLADYTTLSQLPGLTALSPVLAAPCLISADDSSIYKTCRDILLSILNIYIDDIPLWNISCNAMLLQFLVQLNCHHMNTHDLFIRLDTGRQKEYLQKFNKVFEFIDQHYMEDIDLDTVAQAAGFSKCYFSRVFKQFTNTSFHDYLNSRRIQAAVSLLTDSSLPILDIAMRSGFPTLSTFNRIFKKEKHCTPSEFKKYLT